VADIRSSQCLAQVEWQEPGNLSAFQVLAQVEWVEKIDIDIPADPIELTISILGGWLEGITIASDPVEITTSILGDWVEGITIASDPVEITTSILGDWVEGLLLSVDPIEVTISNLGDYVPGFVIISDPISLSLSQQRGILSKYPSSPPNSDLDQIFDCHSQDRFDNWDRGVIVFTTSITGAWLNKTVFASPINLTLSQVGTYVSGVIISSSPISVTIRFNPFVGIITERLKTNWLKWSNIGNLDFTINKTNVAGERPLDWKGWIYAIRKLGSKVVVYGQNGVTVLTPAEKYYGMHTIYRVGLKGKGAIAGDDSVHYFVDNLGQLFRFSEGLEKLDYSEYLSPMLSGLILSWDAANNLLYICDGSRGYVYSQDTGSLGAGPINVTGIDSQTGHLYVTSPATIEIPVFEICTDIYDLGSRRGKNIYSIEVGTDLTENLETAIEYRLSQSADFISTNWHAVDRRGFVYIPCYGKEFRFKFRLNSITYSYFEIDYITVNGEVCRH
jgi:hypothetical protein